MTRYGQFPVIIGACFLSLILSACNTFKNKTDDQAARCKEMKHRLVFDGSTLTDSHANNQSDAWEQRSGLIRLNEDYNQSCS
jgi:hypothetical protein